MSAPTVLRGSRRELALALSDGPRTAHEVAKTVGKPTGSLFGVLRRMHVEGLLLADTDPPTRGTEYTLAPAAREALREPAHAAATVGLLRRGQQLLIVEQPADQLAAQRVLSLTSLAGSVAWAAEVGGGWLLAIESEVSGSYPLQRLEAALSVAGISCRQVHVTGVLAGDELRDRASWLLEEVGAGP